MGRSRLYGVKGLETIVGLVCICMVGRFLCHAHERMCQMGEFVQWTFLSVLLHSHQARLLCVCVCELGVSKLVNGSDGDAFRFFVDTTYLVFCQH